MKKLLKKKLCEIFWQIKKFYFFEFFSENVLKTLLRGRETTRKKYRIVFEKCWKYMIFFDFACPPIRPSIHHPSITHPSILASLRSGTPEGCTRLGYWFARFSRHMRLNFAHFARSHTSCARASRATCAWTSRASRATCAWTSRAYTSKIEDMAEKSSRFARLAHFVRSRFASHMRLNFARFARLDLKNWRNVWKKNRASRATCAWSLRASRALTPPKFKKCLKKKLLHFFLKRLRRIRKS